MSRLKEFIFSSTNRCNLKCKMCDIPNDTLAELTTDEVKNIIRDAYKLGFSTFVFSGGEPLLRKDIFELINFTKNSGMGVCVTSNGCLIDSDTAAKLYQSGVSVVNISIDGNEECHDYLRGKDSFKKAVLALENLRRNNVETTIAVMVCGYNYKSLTGIFELAKEYGVSTIKFQPFSGIFIKEKSRGKDFLIDKNDLKISSEIFEKVIILSKRYGISTSPSAYLRAIPLYLSGEKLVFPSRCGVLWSTCSVNSRGEIYPCWAITGADNLIGNLRENSLLELWDSLKHNQIRDYAVKNGCQGCLMSCYDEVFGKKSLIEGLNQKLEKAKRVQSYKRLFTRSVYGFLKDKFHYLMVRYRFYKSYRGSTRNILGRNFKNVLKRIDKKNGCDSGFNKILIEINISKEKLRKEILNYK